MPATQDPQPTGIATCKMCNRVKAIDDFFGVIEGAKPVVCFSCQEKSAQAPPS